MSIVEQTLGTDNQDRSAAHEIERLLREIDESKTVPQEILEEPSDFIYRIYLAWKKNGGLKHRKKNRNSINEMKKWLSGKKHIKSLQSKIQGKIPFLKDDIENLLNLFFEKWKFTYQDKLDGSSGYDEIECSDKKYLADLIVGEIFKQQGVQVIFSDTKEYVSSDRNVHTLRRRFMDDQYKVAKCVIVSSRNQTVIGANPAITAGGFLRFLDLFFEEDKRNDIFTEPLLVWIVDIGARINGDISSFEKFSNVFLLVSRFVAYATFDGFDNGKYFEDSNIFDQMTKIDQTNKISKWNWLNQKAVVVVENLREDEKTEIQKLRRFKIPIRRIPGIQSQHILPSNIPERWLNALKNLYGPKFGRIDDATVGIALKKEADEMGQEIDYYAHARIPEYKNLENALMKSIKLPAPGKAYDDGMRLVYMAAKCILHDDVSRRSTREEAALDYINLLGYEVLRVADFVRIVTSIPDFDAMNIAEQRLGSLQESQHR